MCTAERSGRPISSQRTLSCRFLRFHRGNAALSSPHSLHLPMALPFSQSCELQIPDTSSVSLSPHIQTSNLLPRLVYSIFLPTHSQRFAEALCGLGQDQVPGDSADPCCSSLPSHSATSLPQLDPPSQALKCPGQLLGVS